MSEIKVNTTKLYSEAYELKFYKKKLGMCASQLGTVSSSLRDVLSGGSDTMIAATLKKLDDKILDQAAKFDSFAEALQYIADQYRNTEKEILGTADSKIPTIGELRELIRRIKDRRNQVMRQTLEGLLLALRLNSQKKKQLEYYTDITMQESIFEIFGREEFSEETWKNASVEERKQILTNFMRTIMPCYGISLVEDIDFYDGKSTSRGYYSSGDNSVHINENALSGANSYTLMSTVIHEMRHGYQHAVVDNPENFQVSKETVKIWKDNFDNYKSTDKGDSFEEYLYQPVEWDAANFAKQYYKFDATPGTPDYEGSWES